MAEDLFLTIEARVQRLGEVLQTVVRDYAPNHLKGYIFVQTSIAPTRATLSIRVENQMPVQKYGSADAGAQEYGMGAQNIRGDSKFDGHIYPVNHTYLVFMGTHEYEGQLIFTQAVNKHPGMRPFEGRGYIAPAVKEFKSTVLPTIDPDIKDFVNIAIRKSFPGAKKT